MYSEYTVRIKSEVQQRILALSNSGALQQQKPLLLL